MPRYTTAVPHLTPDELERRYRKATDPVARSHWHMVWLVATGHRVPTAARLVGYTGTWVRTILRRDNAEGPDGLGDRRQHSPGQPPLLTEPLRAQLRAALAEPPPDGRALLGSSASTSSSMSSAMSGRPPARVGGACSRR